MKDRVSISAKNTLSTHHSITAATDRAEQFNLVKKIDRALSSLDSKIYRHVYRPEALFPEACFVSASRQSKAT